MHALIKNIDVLVIQNHKTLYCNSLNIKSELMDILIVKPWSKSKCKPVSQQTPKSNKRKKEVFIIIIIIM